MLLASDTASWVVAIGTLTLAWVTYQMVTKAGSQVELEQRRLAAQQRPHVFPVASREWVNGLGQYNSGQLWRVLPLANGGPGIALNVTGFIRFADGICSPTLALAIPPNQQYDAMLNLAGSARDSAQEWADARVCLVYQDVAGEDWVTEAEVRVANARRYFDFRRAAPLADFGDLWEWFEIPQAAFMYHDTSDPLYQVLLRSRGMSSRLSLDVAQTSEAGRGQ